MYTQHRLVVKEDRAIPNIKDKCQRIQMGLPKKENPEKLATQGTQDEEKQNNNTTQYVLDTTNKQTNTNNVNKTCALLQPTGSRGEPYIAT